ncbi:MAG: M28 family peptidase [Acidobacteriota bacterium]
MKKIRATVLFLLAALILPLASAAAQKTPKPQPSKPHGNVEAVRAAQLKDYLTFIASDELEGRNTPSRGLDTAALYLASHLSRWGLRPAGDNGTYFQRIALRRTLIDSTQTKAEINGQAFHYGKDFLAALAAGSASGRLVFVGHGWVIKSKNLNAYKGIDVRGKIIVHTAGFPKGVSFQDLTGKQGEDWDNAYSYGQRNGALGRIVIPVFQTMASWEQARQGAEGEGNIEVEKFISSEAAPIPAITASPRMMAVLFAGESRNAQQIFNLAATGEAVEAFDFSPNKKVNFTVAVKTKTEYTQNVVAALEGSDPQLKSEYVAISAHYDHVGIGAPVGGDAIYNGADDDGSGTVSVMAMAEAFAQGPRPRRSILFIWHAGEEAGLWGSRYFTLNPTVPLERIVADLNIDMIGRCKKAGDTDPARAEMPEPNEVFLIGPKIMSAELFELSEAVNRAFLNLKFNYRYDDAKEPNQYFFRSDHFNFARKGIPVIFYMDGDHADYHKPSDSIEKIDFDYMERVARTIFATAWALANRDNRPRVDKPLAPELIDQ